MSHGELQTKGIRSALPSSVVMCCEGNVNDAQGRELCLFFARAPPSYRRSSLVLMNDMRLYIRLAWPMPGEREQSVVWFDGAEALAAHMQNYFLEHNMSAVAVPVTTQGVVVSRL